MVVRKGAVLFSSLIPVALASIFPRQLVPTDLPGNWTSKGCYTDGGVRTLQGAAYTSGTAMTSQSCIGFCDDKGFIYAGTEYSQECYCDNVLHNNAEKTPDTDCNMPCSGDSLQACGAGGRLNLFWSGATPPPPPQEVPSVGKWKSQGCYAEGTTGRALTVGMNVAGAMTIEGCTAACFTSGYKYSGTEYSAEYCGTEISNGGASAPAADCSMTCSGNSSQFCGGPNRLNVYDYLGDDLPPITNPPGGGDPGNPDVPVFPETNLPGNWKYQDCYVDNLNGRILPHNEDNNPALTGRVCIDACAAEGYTVAGIEYSTECYCGTALLNGAAKATSGCSMACGGNATQACGGPNRVSVYSNTTELTIYPVPITKTTGLPGKFKYAGCYTETPGAERNFLYQMINDNLTSTQCMSRCADYGYGTSATQFGREYCGDFTDLAAHDSKKVADTDCNIPCTGDPIHVCGGPNRLSTYTWDGQLTTWATPSVTGAYSFFMPGIVIPLIATVGINNKVTLVEKWGTGFPNSTGAYELDISLVPNLGKAYREMHVKSDVFCGASIILPDKAGRQLNIGGWSLDSTFGVRLYSPSGVEGTNGTTDWEENYPALKLQRGRWYPTAVVMQNSSILVVGGEVGSNGLPEASLEIMPKPPGGDTWLFMDWLFRTDPNNLYPFLQILPNGDVFVAYYNEARILDKVTFATKKILPNIPGAVNDDTAGRTYPLEGAAVMFPQYPPYTDPLTFLVCGGSTIGAAIALDNCASIQPDATNPKWAIERMPSRRVMACMTALPDGTFLIVNGAHQGVAGFGLATDPNFSAILYDPSKPINQRMSILNNTNIARMYHSESTLLVDGRVLISGSDPQTYRPDGTEIYPEEFRLEIYVPPYLATGLKQPTFTLPSGAKDWKYNTQYTISNIKLFQGKISGVRISLLSATSSTHGNTMGQRTIFPKISCSGTSCTLTTPPASAVVPSWHMLFILDGPTPSRAQWVRIGGDPAKLGNWPNLPGFTLPGV